MNEKDEERRSAGYSVPSNRLPRSKCVLKVGRNFLMYVGESIGRWLAFILQSGGPSRDVPIPPLTSLNLVYGFYRSPPHFSLALVLRMRIDFYWTGTCMFYQCLVSFLGTSNRTRVSPRNRASLIALSRSQEKRDREAEITREVI